MLLVENPVFRQQTYTVLLDNACEILEKAWNTARCPCKIPENKTRRPSCPWPFPLPPPKKTQAPPEGEDTAGCPEAAPG